MFGTVIDPTQYAIPVQSFIQTANPVKKPATSMTTPILPGGPTWLTAKNALIGGGILVGSYVAYVLLMPPAKGTKTSITTKPAAVVSGLGRMLGFGRRRRRRRR